MTRTEVVDLLADVGEIPASSQPSPWTVFFAGSTVSAVVALIQLNIVATQAQQKLPDGVMIFSWVFMIGSALGALSFAVSDQRIRSSAQSAKTRAVNKIERLLPRFSPPPAVTPKPSDHPRVEPEQDGPVDVEHMKRYLRSSDLYEGRERSNTSQVERLVLQLQRGGYTRILDVDRAVRAGAESFLDQERGRSDTFTDVGRVRISIDAIDPAFTEG